MTPEQVIDMGNDPTPTPISSPAPSSSPSPTSDSRDSALTAALDIAEVPAVEVVLTVAMHLMSASAIACGLDEEHPNPDLAEARILINALAGLVTAAAPDLGSMHAAPIRDGLSALQRAFREASTIPDAPGMGPGEGLTGPVW